MRSFLLLLTGIVSLSSCSLWKHETQAGPDSISFGSGGGFTGAVDEYILKNNGELCKVKYKTRDTVVIKTLDKALSADFFRKVNTESMKQIQLDQTGNFTYFLALMKDKQIVRAYNWTDGSEVPQELMALYNGLLEQTR